MRQYRWSEIHTPQNWWYFVECKLDVVVAEVDVYEGFIAIGVLHCMHAFLIIGKELAQCWQSKSSDWLRGLLQSLHIVERKWLKINLDFCKTKPPCFSEFFAFILGYHIRL